MSTYLYFEGFKQQPHLDIELFDIEFTKIVVADRIHT